MEPSLARAGTELRRRMRGPQRHRLLHGYPLGAATPPAEGYSEHDEIVFSDKTGRGLIVGVLPHSFCNPGVNGCGFCTFPHEPGNTSKASRAARLVAEEIGTAEFRRPTLFERQVTAIYFGGGTANLIDAEAAALLCNALDEQFATDRAEVTLEGVPAYFLRGGSGDAKGPRLWDVIRKRLRHRRLRISMGLQTFDEDRLRKMGRQNFGTPATFAEVVAAARAEGIATSGDLLFNLPGQSIDETRDDLRRAIDLGLDHLGLYHLVLFRGIGTGWSKDAEMLAGLPTNNAAADNWIALREMLLAEGWRQTTLTNFERGGIAGGPDRFLYEECGFHPDRFDMVGFGPSGISYTAAPDFATGVKVMNPAGSEEYAARHAAGGRMWTHAFAYEPRDQRIGWLIRRIAGLSIDRARYRELFGGDPLEDFADEFAVLTEAGLIKADGRELRPTPRGMFFSDSAAGLLSHGAVPANQEEGAARGRRRIDPRLLVDVRYDPNARAHM